MAMKPMRALKVLEARFDRTQTGLRVAFQILAGRAAREAAERLEFSPETVKSHLGRRAGLTGRGSECPIPTHRAKRPRDSSCRAGRARLA